MWAVVVALVALWILGLVTGIGNLVHLLLLLAVVVTAINLVRGGRTSPV